MFDWNKFVMLGSLLLMEDGEEYIRSAISRQYYGLFGVVRRYLINVDKKYYLQSRNGDVHGKIFDELKKADDDNLNEVLKVFNKLRVARNQADYNGGLNSLHFEKFLQDNEKDLEIALGTIDYFKSHPNY